MISAGIAVIRRATILLLAWQKIVVRKSDIRELCKENDYEVLDLYRDFSNMFNQSKILLVLFAQGPGGKIMVTAPNNRRLKKKLDKLFSEKGGMLNE